ncbi:MAG: efflux RND transporter permease subunit [Deltaproteobacteria bacterium]|nr:efflux RND transporter permease subunit [Deltaproteobacteria bacterium]
MLERILDWSLRHRGVVLVAWAAVAIAGVVSWVHLPIDAFPDTTPVQVQVNTVAPSLAPLEIERQITVPVEASVGGLPGLVEVRSVSKFGFSQVTATFAEGTDIYLARQTVSERLQGVELPRGVARPTLGPVATGLGEVFHYLLTGELSLAELRTIHEWVVRPQMMGVPGVAEVNTWGGDARQFHVLVDPGALQRYELSLGAVSEAIEANSANVGGGTMDRGGESTLVHGVGFAEDLDDIEAMVVAAREGVPVRVRDIGRVAEGRQIRRGAVTADGQGEAVLGLGFMLIGDNPHEVTSALSARLTEVSRSLPEGAEIVPLYDRTTLVDRVLDTVRTNLLEGALLVLLVIFAFLRDIRAGLIVSATIPLSMLVASNMMLAVGVAGSLMSLGAIDFGLLVDSSVIQVENVVHRLEAAAGADRLAVIRDAVQEVRGPTIFGELIIAIVYLPILTLEGIEGQMFRPMALTVLFALGGSMLLSLTLTPVLSSYLLRTSKKKRPSRLGAALDNLGNGVADLYELIVRHALRRPAIVLGAAVLALLTAGGLAPQLGSEFVPRLREGAIVVNTVRLAGVSVAESVRYGTAIEQFLVDRFPNEVEHVWTRTGSAEVATDPMGLELSDVFITLTPRDRWTRAETQDELVEAMSADLSEWPAMRAIFTQPIEMRVNEMNAGIRSDLGVMLFGDDFDVLREKAGEIERILSTLDGAADVLAEQTTGQPVLRVEVDRDAIARHGIPARDVLAMARAVGPVEVGSVQEGQLRFPIAIRLDEPHRGSPEAIGRLLVSAPNGDRIPLRRLANIELEEGPSTVKRTWGRRRIVVEANVRGRDVGSFVQEARAAIQERVDLPGGYYVRYGGQFEHLQNAQKRLMIVVPIALALILLLLYLTYRRVSDALRVFTGVPFAAVGGIVALWLRDMPFSVSAGVGFVALSGVAVLGDMVLVSAIRDRLRAGDPLGRAIATAARRRLRPVLMTALVASLGFVPMALNTGFGAEVQRPLATVVIGGVFSSTALTLLVVPILFSVTSGRWGRNNGGPPR